MKFVAIINPKKTGDGRITSFIYSEPGPLPPIIDPEKPEEAKDGGPPDLAAPRPDEASKKPS